MLTWICEKSKVIFKINTRSLMELGKKRGTLAILTPVRNN
jgi:hypothetical protein